MRRAYYLCFVLSVAIAVTGCASVPSPELALNKGQTCSDDSSYCVGQRQAALRNMTADPKRTWIREPATPYHYASGVRLFAFKTKKRDLTCEELVLGRKEAEAADGALRGPGTSGLTAGQMTRGKLLASEVARELSVEHGRRCKR